MKASRYIFWPAIVLVLASVLLAAYSFFGTSKGNPPVLQTMAGMEGQRPPHDQWKEWFNNLGTIALAAGAVSMSWLRFKKKLASSSTFIKKLSKLLYKVHLYSGWIALALIIVHGVYYLFTNLKDHAIYSGLAAFLMMIAMGLYGMLLKKSKSKAVRKIHFLLSLLWIPFLVVHAGGSMLMTAAVTIIVWCLVPIVEKLTLGSAAEAA